MEAQKLFKLLNLENKVISVKRMKDAEAKDTLKPGCALNGLHGAFEGETIILSVESSTCRGGHLGLGFCDGLPNMPGGFGNFMAQGKGEGFPKGEKVKINSEVADDMLLSQPQDVLDGAEYIKIKPYEDGDDSDIVTALVNPDQLAILVNIFYFRKSSYDDIICPMSAGCTSVFRIPFGELKREVPRAVIGNVDLVSRKYFDKDKVFFTVSGKDFKQMLDDAENTVVTSHIFQGVADRL